MTQAPNKKILSDITVHMKYAKYKPDDLRRETWDEIVDRNMEMHIKTYPQLEKDIRDVYTHFVKTKKVLPSMRSMQFGGKPIEISPNRVYNCAYMPIDTHIAFIRRNRCWLFCSKTSCGIDVSYSASQP